MGALSVQMLTWSRAGHGGGWRAVRVCRVAVEIADVRTLWAESTRLLHTSQATIRYKGHPENLKDTGIMYGSLASQQQGCKKVMIGEKRDGGTDLQMACLRRGRGCASAGRGLHGRGRGVCKG